MWTIVLIAVLVGLFIYGWRNCDNKKTHEYVSYGCGVVFAILLFTWGCSFFTSVGLGCIFCLIILFIFDQPEEQQKTASDTRSSTGTNESSTASSPSSTRTSATSGTTSRTSSSSSSYSASVSNSASSQSHATSEFAQWVEDSERKALLAQSQRYHEYLSRTANEVYINFRNDAQKLAKQGQKHHASTYYLSCYPSDYYGTCHSRYMADLRQAVEEGLISLGFLDIHVKTRKSPPPPSYPHDENTEVYISCSW